MGSRGSQHKKEVPCQWQSHTECNMKIYRGLGTKQLCYIKCHNFQHCEPTYGTSGCHVVTVCMRTAFEHDESPGYHMSSSSCKSNKGYLPWQHYRFVFNNSGIQVCPHENLLGIIFTACSKTSL